MEEGKQEEEEEEEPWDSTYVHAYEGDNSINRE